MKIFTCSYIKKVYKNVYVFLVKVLATTKQLIRRNSIYCLKNQAIFFPRVSIQTGLTSPLPQPLPPSTTKPLSKRVRWKRRR